MVEPLGGLASRMVWSVASLVQAVADALAARFAVCVVRGELSGFSRAASGHCYFSLKDADGGGALIRCAMFRRAAGLLDFAPGDGQLVELRGRVGVYEPRGELQFVVESMQRAGAGALYEQFLRLKARLEVEGLFDPSRKRTLPGFARRVGVVTSLGAAALRDVCAALARRSPHVEVVVYPSAVQGAEAPAALCAALEQVATRHEVDVLIVCRGGGSLEDLWAFNDERVVRAIAAMPLPVVSGVGHETDVTLADLAADLRAPTPTAAAELVAVPTDQCLDQLAGLLMRMRRRLRSSLDRQAQGLDTVALRLARPAANLQRHSQRLELLSQRMDSARAHQVDIRRMQLLQRHDRLRRATANLLKDQSASLQTFESRLRALDPGHVLARGYAWLADEHGRAVLSVDQVSVGSPLKAVLHDGQVDVRVTGVSPRC